MNRALAALAATVIASMQPSPAPDQTQIQPSPKPSPEYGYTLRADLNHGSWVQGPTLPAPRQYAATAVLNGRIYLFGGFSANHKQTDSTLVLQPGLVTSTPPPELQGGPIPSNLGTWQTAAPVPESVDNAAAVAYQGYIYLAGGRIENKVTNKAFRYDPVSDTWDEMRSMPVPRHGATMQAVAGKLYLIGGAAAHGNDEVSIEVFDIAHGTWSMLDNALATARIGGSSAVINGQIAIVGGMTHDGRVLDSVDYYDPVRSRWTFGFHMHQSRAHFGLTTIENRLIAIGGIIPGIGPDEPATTQTMEISAGVAQGWMSGPWMPFPRQGMSVASLGNIVYVIGGSPWYGVGPVADVRRYVSPLIRVQLGPRTH
ncbi:MAG TPA: kelch repeat-containing protein [Candidatus Eremiobacteraceae bacterium]|nr:kelch repeat-containing protein [Candidatus Eremiobacteraceae bacterium]